MPTECPSKTETIRQLNDRFRRALRGGRVVITSGVQALGPHRLLGLLTRVRAYCTFDEGNDPYGEHDFGSFVEGGQKFFWKIDYYDLKLEYGSEDPADPAKTVRVLTIMLADEY